MSGVTNTNLSLRYFQEMAKQSDKGEIRFSSDGDGKARLINKGWAFNVIASPFYDLARRLAGTEDTRNQRNERALNAFREALVGTYGDHGEDALKALGMHEGNHQVLTGAVVLQLMGDAEQRRLESINDQRDQYRDQDLYGDVMDELRNELAEKAPRTSGIWEQEFRNRLSERCRFESDLYSRALSPGEVKRFAQEEKDSLMARLEGGGHRIAGVRSELASESRALLEDGKDERAIRDGAQAILQAIYDLKAEGDISAPGEDGTKRYAKATFAQRLTDQITDRHGNIDTKRANELGKLQHGMLQEDSPLRQAYHKLDANEKLVLEGMVEAMARVLAPITNSGEGDLERLRAPLPNPGVDE